MDELVHSTHNYKTMYSRILNNNNSSYCTFQFLIFYRFYSIYMSNGNYKHNQPNTSYLKSVTMLNG